MPSPHVWKRSNADDAVKPPTLPSCACPPACLPGPFSRLPRPSPPRPSRPPGALPLLFSFSTSAGEFSCNMQHEARVHGCCRHVCAHECCGQSMAAPRRGTGQLDSRWCRHEDVQLAMRAVFFCAKSCVTWRMARQSIVWSHSGAARSVFAMLGKHGFKLSVHAAWSGQRPRCVAPGKPNCVPQEQGNQKGV